jgi:hypothetical protein
LPACRSSFSARYFARAPSGSFHGPKSCIFPPDLLRPPLGRVREEREVRVGLARLLGCNKMTGGHAEPRPIQGVSV